MAITAGRRNRRPVPQRGMRTHHAFVVRARINNLAAVQMSGRSLGRPAAGRAPPRFHSRVSPPGGTSKTGEIARRRGGGGEGRDLTAITRRRKRERESRLS